MADTPHFDLPFRFHPNVICVEQDTIEDVTNCVEILLRTDYGSRPEAPDIGVSDLTFNNQPINEDRLHDEIVASEPRAILLISERPDVFDEMIDRITIQVRTGGGQ